MDPVHHDTLRDLDDALVAVRRALQHPVYRRRLLRSVGDRFELATLRMLRAVERHPEPSPSVGEIAEALGIEPSTASRTVDRCVSAGLLARSPSDLDRRRAVLRLTDEGRVVLGRVTAARREVLVEVTAGCSSADIGRLSGLLADLVAGLDRLEDCP